MKAKTTKKVVFVVEDDPDISELICFVLKKEGFTTNIYEDSANIEPEVISLKPDLIIMDLWIDDTDGAVITKNLKKRKETANTPVVLISAKNSLDKIAKQCGADGYLAKPFTLTELKETVHKFLNTKIS